MNPLPAARTTQGRLEREGSTPASLQTMIGRTAATRRQPQGRLGREMAAIIPPFFRLPEKGFHPPKAGPFSWNLSVEGNFPDFPCAAPIRTEIDAS
jgi:hypothetical protein